MIRRLLCLLLAGFLLTNGAYAASVTVSPSFMGTTMGQPQIVPAPQYPVSVFRTWGLWDAAHSRPTAYWCNIETVQGVYDFSNLDTQVAVLLASVPGVKLAFTYGGCTPSFYNASAGRAVPPTVSQNFYNYVAALNAHILSKGWPLAFVSLQNEADQTNPTVGFCTPACQALMPTWAAVIYPAFKALFPTVLFCTPSVSSYAFISVLDTYLAAGASAYTDCIDYHSYAAPAIGGTGPEQFWNADHLMRAMADFYGLTSVPVLTDEGGFLTGNITAANYGLWTAISILIQASDGLLYKIWYANDGGFPQTNFGPLVDASIPQAVRTIAGAAYRVVAGWISNATFTSPIAPLVASNQLTNPNGLCSGNPCSSGVTPTGWGPINNPDSGHGMTAIYAGACTDGVVNGIAVTVSGTALAGANGFINVPMTSSAISTSQQFWRMGGYVNYSTAGGSSTANFTSQLFKLVNQSSSSFNGWAPITPYKLSETQFSTGAATSGLTSVQMIYQFLYSVTGLAINETVCLAGLTLDSSGQWEGQLTRSDGTQAQIDWDASGNGASVTTPGFATSYMDISSGQFAPGASVPQTLSPILWTVSKQKFLHQY